VSPRPSAVARLRAETAAAHDTVDAVYSRYDLADPAGYRAFLEAHARALPAVERALSGAALPAWRERTSALAADLDALGATMPPALPFAPPADLPAAWGMLYVTEGSRLGGVLLERAAGPDLPRAYLSARHRPGEWRALLADLDAAATDERWAAAAVAGAHQVFTLYGDAAAQPR
jgi:heme oxygenase (biliverdin-IX-beta and delta-forming)